MPLYVSDIRNGDATGYTQEVVVVELANASEPISALRPVRWDGNEFAICHADQFAELQEFVGLAKNAASAPGEQVTAHTFGDIEDGGWLWTPGELVYIDDMGNLSHTPGTHVLEVGRAWSPTKLFVNPESAIFVE